MTRRTPEQIGDLAAARAGISDRLRALRGRTGTMSLATIANLHDYLDDFREDERERGARARARTATKETTDA